MAYDDSITLSYVYLSRLWRKCFRNGNLRKLSRIERALYQASLSLARKRGRIVNPKLILELRSIIGKLCDMVGERLMNDAYQRAAELYRRYVNKGLFEWAPQVRTWFHDPSYILWLGLNMAWHML